MNSVKIKKDQLLATLRTNLQQHVTDYNKAVVGYQEAAKEALHNKQKELLNNPTAPLTFEDLEVPRSYEKAYKQVIRMLEFEVRDEIELNSSQFGCFVMDDWDWKEEFSVSNTKYMNFSSTRR